MRFLQIVYFKVFFLQEQLFYDSLHNFFSEEKVNQLVKKKNPFDFSLSKGDLGARI